MAKQTQEIPPERWPAYLNQIGELYQGWAVSIEVMGRDIGDQPAADNLPLQGLSFETGDILISAGNQAAYLTHHVDHPRSVRAADLTPGTETDIQIEADDGTTTIVHLRRQRELPA